MPVVNNRTRPTPADAIFNPDSTFRINLGDTGSSFAAGEGFSWGSLG
jgi:hypothetical protein